jgi:hypothetical protein
MSRLGCGLSVDKSFELPREQRNEVLRRESPLMESRNGSTPGCMFTRTKYVGEIPVERSEAGYSLLGGLGPDLPGAPPMDDPAES